MPKKKQSSKSRRGASSGGSRFNPFKILDTIQSGIMYILGKLAYLFLFVIVFAFLVSIVNNKLSNYPLVTVVNNVGLMFAAIGAAITSGRLEVIGSVIVDILIYFGYSIVQILQYSIQFTFQVIGGGIYGLLNQTGDIYISQAFVGISADVYISLTNFGILISLNNVLGFTFKFAFTAAGGSDLSSNVLLAFNNQGFANMLSLKFSLSFGGDIVIPPDVLNLGINTKISDYLGNNNTFTFDLPFADTKLTIGAFLKPLQLDSITVPIPDIIKNPINDFIDTVKTAMGYPIKHCLLTDPFNNFKCVSWLDLGTVNDWIKTASLGTIDILSILPDKLDSFGYTLPKEFLDLGLSYGELLKSVGIATSYSITIPDFIANIGVNITVQTIFDFLGLGYTINLPTIPIGPFTLSAGDFLTGLTTGGQTIDWFDIIKQITG